MHAAILASLLHLGATSNPEQQSAAKFFHQSVTEYELGNFDAALVDIAKAYRLDPRPALLFNLGQCHRALHHWERATFFYREYLHKTPGAPNRALVTDLIADMARKIKEEAPGAASAPKQLVLVEAPPQGGALPAQVVTEPVKPAPDRGHGLGIGLLSAGGALALLAGVAALEIVHYNGAYAGAANHQAGRLAYTPVVAQAQSQANTWQIVEISSAILAVAGVGFAPFVW